MVEIKIAQKIFTMQLVEWEFGRALLSRDEATPAPPGERSIIGASSNGKILRLFAPKPTSHDLSPRWRG